MSDLASILIADDEEVIREACTRILGRAGFRTAAAADGEQAVRLLREGDFDLVLLDIKMPVFDGLQIMQIIQRENIQTRVVVITGHGTAQTAAQAAALGSSDFLSKPFSPNELRQAVAAVLEERKTGS